MSLRLNPLVASVKESGTLAINLEVRRLRSQGIDVFHFGFGQSPFPVHPDIIRHLARHVPRNDYLPTGGLPELREAISSFLWKYQGIRFPADRLFIGPGSKILLQQVIYLLEARFLLSQGSWVSYIPQIQMRGGKYEIIPTRLEDQHKVTPEALQQVCLKYPGETMALILNSPNNPTGAVYTRDELAALAEVADRFGLIVLSDEIYTQLFFDDDFAPSMAPLYPHGTIVFGGLSKLFSAGGYRLGFVGIPRRLRPLIAPLRATISETYSAVSTPIQYGAVYAYGQYERIRPTIHLQKRILGTVGAYTQQRLQRMGLWTTQPRGGFYLIVDFEPYRTPLEARGIRNADELTRHLLQHYRVALLPGQDFAFDAQSLACRLAFVDFDGESVMDRADGATLNEAFVEANIPRIRQGLDVLETFINSLKS